MQKQTKISFFLIGLSALLSIAYNAIFVFTKREEAALFILALAVLGLFLISIIYNLSTFAKKGKPKDLWKLGWLGFVGFIGVVLNFTPILYWLFVFFLFFFASGSQAQTT